MCTVHCKLITTKWNFSFHFSFIFFVWLSQLSLIVGRAQKNSNSNIEFYLNTAEARLRTRKQPKNGNRENWNSYLHIGFALNRESCEWNMEQEREINSLMQQRIDSILLPLAILHIIRCLNQPNVAFEIVRWNSHVSFSFTIHSKLNFWEENKKLFIFPCFHGLLQLWPEMDIFSFRSFVSLNSFRYCVKWSFINHYRIAIECLDFDCHLTNESIAQITNWTLRHRSI